MGRWRRPGWLVDGEGDWPRNGDGDRDWFAKSMPGFKLSDKAPWTPNMLGAPE